MPNDTDLEWFLNEPEELARLAHYVVNERGLRNHAAHRQFRGMVFPGMPGEVVGQAGYIVLLAPAGAVPAFHAHHGAYHKKAGLTGTYGSWFARTESVTEVCDGVVPQRT